MSYRNKTYVAFASENLGYYRLMEAWRDRDNIDFTFYDAHDLYPARDTSLPATIKHNLRERMKNTKQIVLLGSPEARKKGGDGVSFLAYEIEVALELDLPIVIANLDKSRQFNSANIPRPLIAANYHSMSVSFQAAIIMYALDNYAPHYAANRTDGPKQYKPSVYTQLGLLGA